MAITDTSRAIIKILEKNGYIEIVQDKIERNPFVNKKIKKDKPLALTEEQQYAYNTIMNVGALAHLAEGGVSRSDRGDFTRPTSKEFLIYGITGSRKN